MRRRRRNGAPAFVCPQPLLAQDRVRYVGDPVAFIVAETVNQAKDAAELIDIDYEPLAGGRRRRGGAGAGCAGGLGRQPRQRGVLPRSRRQGSAVDGAFAKAAHVVRHKTVINRVTANSMEPRGCLAQYDRDQDRYTIRCTVQSVHGTRAALADRIFKLPHHQFRVICDNMGGGFGMKGGCYPEYALSLWASEVIGRPVRWIAERSEGLMSDEQGRGSIIDTELALDRDGRFLALRTKWSAAIGAYFSTDRPTIPLIVGLGCLVNTYGIPAVHAQVTAVLTNTMTIAPYRGGGRPEPIYVTETIIDKAAHRARHRPRPSCAAATRSRQARCRSRPRCSKPTIAAISQEPRGLSGRSPTTIGRSNGARPRKRAASSLGIGVATAVAATGGRDYEHAEIRFDPSGGVVLMTGSMDHGQGHGTTFKQVLSEKLGIDADLIRYRYGDSDLVTMGIGTFGSRSAQLAGSAIVVAADRLIDKGRKIAAHMMEAAIPRRRLRERQIRDRRHRPVGRHRRSRQAIVSFGAIAKRCRDRLYRAGQFRPRRSARPFRAARILPRSRSTRRPARSP